MNVPRTPSEPTKAPDLRVSRHAHLAEAFEIFAAGMGPFVDERMATYFPGEESWESAASMRMGRPTEHGATDPLFQLLVMRRFWGPVFQDFFGDGPRRLIDQLIEARNLWAHLSLPDDSAYLDRVLLAIERVLAPVSPDNVSSLRRIRVQIKEPGSATAIAEHHLDSADLRLQLGETVAAFEELQESQRSMHRQQLRLTKELETSRRASAGKQHRLTELEKQLLEESGRSEVLQTYLQAERAMLYRIEWLFVGFMAGVLLLMILIVS